MRVRDSKTSRRVSHLPSRKMTTSSGSFFSLLLMKRSRCFWCMHALWCTCVSTCGAGALRMGAMQRDSSLPPLRRWHELCMHSHSLRCLALPATHLTLWAPALASPVDPLCWPDAHYKAESPESLTHLSDVVEVAVRGGLLREELLVGIQLLVQAELLLQQHQAVVAERLGGAHGRDPQHPAGPAVLGSERKNAPSMLQHA